jgi:CRP-like cAMP-binding protein
LPPSLSCDIKIYLFSSLIQSWEAIPKENFGEVISLLNKLTLVTYPEHEYIVTAGEIGREMYFIVEGLCQVVSPAGDQLEVLKKG